MSGNWKLRVVRMSNLSSSLNSASDKVEADVITSRVKKEESDEPGSGSGLGFGLYPERPGEPDCAFYLKTGTCGFGAICRFNHPSDRGAQVYGVKNEFPERDGKPDCEFFVRTGTCKFGSICKYNHPREKQAESSVVSLNTLGLPMRKDAKPCMYYMKTGTCKYTYACKFHHPQPPRTANVTPVPVYGSAGVSSTGGTFFSSPVLQLQQNYIPVVLSPSQGWNTYMGSLRPLSVSSVVTAPGYNCHLSVPYLPERPDQPECRYFLNNGSCMFGAHCRYHHPREKTSQLAPSSIGPYGLPLRPGQPICSYYYFYGLCKNGPTCRYDHPLDGYAHAYSMSLPPLASSYLSSMVRQSNDSVKKDDTPTRNKNDHSSEEKPDTSDSLPRSSSRVSSEGLQEEKSH